MIPPLTFAQALVQLALLTSQTANFTFTSDELTQALQTAWNDTYVCNSVWDSSTSFVVGTWQYALPAAVTVVQDLYYTRTTTDYPERISPELYEIVNGKIQFTVFTPNWINDTNTIYIKGRYKLATTDNLTTDALVNYVISLAAYILLKQLVYKHTLLFLKNDTSMADIINARRDMQQDVLLYRQALLREYESA